MEDIRISDMMVVSLARLLKNKENTFHGVASIMPMVAIMLSRKVHNKELTYLNITGGVNIEDAELTISTDGNNLFQSSKSVVKLTDIFDLSARNKLDIAFLSCSQVDQYGNINNSVIGNYHNPKVRLPGGAGSAVLLPTAKEAIVWKSKHDTRSFVENVDFITAKGNVSYVVTPKCIFKRVDGKLKLYELYPFETLDGIIENTSFSIDHEGFSVSLPPTGEEMIALNQIDPDRLRDSEL